MGETKTLKVYLWDGANDERQYFLDDVGISHELNLGVLKYAMNVANMGSQGASRDGRIHAMI